MTTTETTVSNLKINRLTKAQYDGTTPSSDELYYFTDLSSILDNKANTSSLDGKLDKSGGTMTGTLSVGNSAHIETNGYITATWFKTTSVTDNNNLTSVAVIDSSGWIYKQPKSTLLSGCQTTSNLVTSVSSSSTDSQYPSAKLFYDTVGDIESALNTINSGSST